MPPKRALGPFDKRRRVTRCQACATRKIRCSGGIPCSYCVRTNRNCLEQDKKRPATTIIGHTHDVIYQSRQSRKTLNQQMGNRTEIRYIDQFMAFIRRNRFTRRFRCLPTEVVPLLHTSTLLSLAVTAIGALDAARHASVSTHRGQESPRLIALSAYSSSLRELQTALADSDVARREDVLWGTFFLGLFELMADPSGEGWAKHMLSGTSKLLQLAGPGQKMSTPRQMFFELFRVLEASRTLLYGATSILPELEWLHSPRDESSATTDQDGLETMLSLMIRTSTFSARFFDLVHGVQDPDLPLIHALGLEGLEIQRSIYEWHNRAIILLDQVANADFLQLAFVYSHALLIFLSNNYNYYPYWSHRQAPRLSHWETDYHVDAILEQADRILTASDIPGVLLFFPLRVAGSRAKDGMQRARILGMLDRVWKNGFMVSKRIGSDLQEYWEYHKMRVA
ncbi:Zn(II)2Cys6 transcription factor [Aspergillus thermomutatus]|uniref:Zn(2)-C6 fungal-type domain-containing protein n=1 Tax=Aspergillus thermomutatus TaxID=41047 RepID=A0A397G757_ASPTH|nr:uncharacterized protein CDV56_102731 [Aspergillus thermomutatus]RHZ43940.1 hypothetical protein CDV56_102731 [Aspergillus thermomutatus]